MISSTFRLIPTLIDNLQCCLCIIVTHLVADSSCKAISHKHFIIQEKDVLKLPVSFEENIKEFIINRKTKASTFEPETTFENTII